MKKVLAMILALMMVFTIAGSALAASDTVGTYKLSEMVEGEESYGSEYMDLMEAVGMTCMLYISDDGTALLDMFGETQELTWDDSYLTADGESIAYTIDGDQLVLAEGDLSLTFTKISDEIVTPEESAADAGDPFADDADAGVAAVVTAPGEYYAEPLAEGDIGDYHAAIVGAEAFKDSDDKDAIRFYYEFTNNSDDMNSSWVLNLHAEQEGFELVTTYPSYDEYVPESWNNSLDVMPGASILCVEEYNFKATGEGVTFTISNYYGDEVSYTFEDVANLPGRPMEWTPAPVADPQTFIDYPLSAETDNIVVTFTDAEVVTYDDNNFIRVYFDITNNTDEATSPLWLTTFTAYQDGIEMGDYNYLPSSDSDSAYYDDLEPGDTVNASCTWDLRTDSPVEVVVIDYVGYSDIIAAATIDVVE